MVNEACNWSKFREEVMVGFSVLNATSIECLGDVATSQRRVWKDIRIIGWGDVQKTVSFGCGITIALRNSLCLLFSAPDIHKVGPQIFNYG